MNLKEKKGGKRQVIKQKILFITLFLSLFALFIYRRKKKAHTHTHKSMTKRKKKSDEQHILNKPKVL